MKKLRKMSNEDLIKELYKQRLKLLKLIQTTFLLKEDKQKGALKKERARMLRETRENIIRILTLLRERERR
jgi:ribosomal protein L29